MRDRTSELRETDSDDEETKLVWNLGVDGNDPFFKQVCEVRGEFAELGESVSRMEAKQSKILSSALPQDCDVQDLQTLRDNIKNKAKVIRTHIKNLDVKESNFDSVSMDFRMRKTQHDVLSRQFVEMMSRCHSVQSEYRQRNIERIHRQLQITGVTVTEERMEEMLESGKPEIFTANLTTDTQVTKQTLNEIQTRKEEIFKLEKSLRDLHDLFMYIAMEVEEQGETIDSIESNVVNSVNYVEKATADTAKAVTSQGRARKKKIAIIICVCVAITVLVTVIVIASLVG